MYDMTESFIEILSADKKERKYSVFSKFQYFQFQLSQKTEYFIFFEVGDAKLRKHCVTDFYLLCQLLVTTTGYLWNFKKKKYCSLRRLNFISFISMSVAHPQNKIFNENINAPERLGKFIQISCEEIFPYKSKQI